MSLNINSPFNKRELPRITCIIECIGDTKKGYILNISAGGAFILFIGSSEPETPIITLNFGLPGRDFSIILESEIQAIQPHRSVGTELRVKFLSLDNQTKQEIHRYVMGQTIKEISAATEDKILDVDPASVKSIAKREQISSTLIEAMNFEGEKAGRIFHNDVSKFQAFRLEQVNPKGLSIMIGDKNSSGPMEHDLIHLIFFTDGILLHACTKVTQRSGKAVSTMVPNQLFAYQKQIAGAKAINRTTKVELPLPFPPGKKLVRDIIHTSKTDLTFKVAPDESYFLPGTPIFDMSVIKTDGQKILHKAAQVINITPVSGSDGTVSYLKVMVGFQVKKEGVITGSRKVVNPKKSEGSFLSRIAGLFKWLVPRPAQKVYHEQRSHSLVVRIIRYPNSKREELVAILDSTNPDTSAHMVAPVVIIPPAHAKRKESTSALALTLIDNFRKNNKELIVIRYDGIRNLGESYKDPECRRPGLEGLKCTLSQGVSDIQATLDYVYNNPLFTPTKVILLSLSLQGVMGRRAVFLDQGKRIHYWMGVIAAPAGQEIIRNVSGGLDYIAQYAMGIRAGEASIMGVLIDTDRFCKDALHSRLSFMADAKNEVGEIPIPITWLSGIHDAWIDPSTVDEFLGVSAPAQRDHIRLPIGHIPLNSDEALVLFKEVTSSIWHFLFNEKMEPSFPSWKSYINVRKNEWGRTPKALINNKEKYWKEYLLGSNERRISYDVLTVSDEYNRFIKKEVKALDVKAGHHIADMGCGTGNLVLQLLKTKGQRSESIKQIDMIDFVDDVLEQAVEKINVLCRENSIVPPTIERHCLSLEINPLQTMKRFLAGEFFGYEELTRVFNFLTGYTVEMWKSVGDWRLHSVLRGREEDPRITAYVKSAFPVSEYKIIMDVNRLSRFLLGKLTPRDLLDSSKAKFDRNEHITIRDLKWSILELKNLNTQKRFNFEDEIFDRVICSLVLSYLDNPLETLREFHRCMKPGGKLIVSSMNPDVDISKIYRNLIRKVEGNKQIKIPYEISKEDFLDDCRHYVNAASLLFKFAEEGQFAFYSPGEMCQLVERAGFSRTEIHTSFGNPPQAHIIVGNR